jgi:hypothetical protein
MLAVRIKIRTGLLLDGITRQQSSQKKTWNQAGEEKFRLKKGESFLLRF